MVETLLTKYGIKQIGYYVESIEETARAMRERLGAGPFIDLGANKPSSLLYRGNESGTLTRSSKFLPMSPMSTKTWGITACTISASGLTMLLR